MDRPRGLDAPLPPVACEGGRGAGRHLAVVTNFYPDRRHNSEYGWHLVQALRDARPDHRVSVIAGAPGPAGPDVHRLWTYGGYGVAGELCRAVRRLDPDAVLVNASLNAWGSSPASLSAFWGMHRLAGLRPTLVLLHYLAQTLPVTPGGFRLGPHHRAGIHVACRLAARAHVVAFTLERDREYFRRHFKPEGTFQVDHGLLGSFGEAGWDEEDAVPTVLAFGYWGPGKNLEAVIRAVEDTPDLRLVIAGASHPCFPGYLEGLRERHPSPRIRLTGYVPEEDMRRVFRRARVLVLPYVGDTGTSGVLHLAAQQGRAVLASDISVLREEGRRLGLSIRFFLGDEGLRAALGRLDPEGLLAEGRHNLEAMRRAHQGAQGERWWSLVDGLLGGRTDAPLLPVVAGVGS